MKVRLTRISGMMVLALFASALFAPSEVQAQDGRSRVLIPDLFPGEDTDDNFGEDVAEELRELMDEQVRFVAVEKDEIEDILDDFDMDMDELTCVTSRQLAPQVSANVVLCATYQDVGNDMMEFTEIAFHVTGGGEPFNLELFTSDKDDEEETAQQIMEAFDAFVELTQFRDYCFEYSQLQQWEDAERNCTGALDANPNDSGIRFQLAQIYRELERLDEALAEIDVVVEQDPYNADALNVGGYIATQLGQEDKGLDYYTRYLEVTPDAAAVRRRIAYDMYEAGDPAGAMQLLEEGVGPDADIGIYSDYGTYAFNTARERLEDLGIDPSNHEGPLPAEVTELYETAIGALERVYEELGDSAQPAALRNVVVARIQLDELAEAEAFGARLTETFPENETVWVSYAQSLQLQDKIDAALEAWSEVEAINPEFPNLYTRQANLLLSADRRDDAVPLLQRAVESGYDGSAAARMLFADAYSKGTQGDRGAQYTIDGIQAAKQFDVNDETASMLNFFHGYVRYQQGVQAAAPETLQSAERALPIFREAQQLLEGGRAYASNNDQNLGQILEAVAQYIDIQELLIERGR